LFNAIQIVVFVLVCAHASRTKIIGRFLDKKTAYQNIFELEVLMQFFSSYLYILYYLRPLHKYE
jgi:hypothetical protein